LRIAVNSRDSAQFLVGGGLSEVSVSFGLLVRIVVFAAILNCGAATQQHRYDRMSAMRRECRTAHGVGVRPAPDVLEAQELPVVPIGARSVPRSAVFASALDEAHDRASSVKRPLARQAA
jgi:hypothetical protein